MNDTFFHAGERLIQEATGERQAALMNGRSIATRIPAGAKAFIGQQRNCAIGWASESGDVWASFLAGPAGFAACTDDLLGLDLQLPDPFGTLLRVPPMQSIRAGDPLGLLWIELATRRRLRVNGVVVGAEGPRLRVQVQQAYANCPKYIQSRVPTELRPDLVGYTVAMDSGTHLDAAQLRHIRRSDTFFVASVGPLGQMDVSHRGGAPGFVQLRDGALWVPDYPGNSMFNTLGNFALNPHAGLTFPDFENNTQLQLTGQVRLHLDVQPDAELTAGTSRWWSFLPGRWISSSLNSPQAWHVGATSPFNPEVRT